MVRIGMDVPRLRLRLPDGRELVIGAEAVVGRAAIATVRIDDPRISTVHAEVSIRDGHYVILARGGRVLMDGVPVPEAQLQAGARVTLAPGVALEVLEVAVGAEAGIPRTKGRDRLTFHLGEAVAIHLGDEPAPRLVVDGIAGRALAGLLSAPAGAAWDVHAAALWPEDAALRARRGPWKEGGWTPIDERRLRNRWDQLLASLRAQLEQVRTTRMITTRGGLAAIELEPQDQVVRPPTR
jgi:hypothetical protein